MTVYTFQFIALDSNGEQMPNVVGSFYGSSDTAFVTPIQVTAQDGTLTTTPTANRLGLVTFSYDGDDPRGYWKSGAQSIPVVANEAADTAAAAAVAAQAAAEAAAATTTAPTEATVRTVITTDLADPATPTSEAVAAAAQTVVDSIAPDNAARAVGKGELTVNVLDHGVIGNNSANDTTAFVSARDAALATGRKLWVPDGLQGVRLSATVDCRFIDIQFDSPIVITQDSGPGLILGDSSAQAPQRRISWDSITSSVSSAPTNPCVRIIGMRGVTHVGACDYLQLFADGSDPAETSITYATFILAGGQLRKLELFGQNGGWINDNKFFGGRFASTGGVFRITGDYPHNGNKFYGTTMEGVEVDILTGHHNLLQNIRTETGVTVTFAAGTYANEITATYGASSAAGLDANVTVTDAGQENVVVTTLATRLRPVEVLRLDRHTKTFDSASEYQAGVGDTIIPGIRHLKVRGSNDIVLDSGMVEIDQSAEATVPSGIAREVSLRTTRFLFAASHKIIRPRVYGYDASGILIDPTSNPIIDMSGGWAVNGTFVNFSSPVAAARIIVVNSAVKFLRLQLLAPTAGSLFDWISLVAYTQPLQSEMVANAWRRTLSRPLFQTAAPTQGLAMLGENIGHATGRFTCVARTDTTLATAAASAATTVTVVSATGVTAGDLVGVLLDDGTTHWTTVASLSGTTITLSVALPGTAAVGQQLSTNRWVSLT